MSNSEATALSISERECATDGVNQMTRNVLILGAGTVGTMVANKLRRSLKGDQWNITLVDRDEIHYYQPGFLFMPFGIYGEKDVIKARRTTIVDGVDFILADIERVDAAESCVYLADDRVLPYDYLIIASGTTPRPDETEGLNTAAYGDTIHDFYTFKGASALAKKLAAWEGGRLVVNVMEMPIKCPVAPLEFAFLADWFFSEKGMRDRVDITYVTPLPGAFTKPQATAVLGGMLKDRNIKLVPEFNVMEVDSAAQTLIAYDEESVPYDLLVTVPVNMGADFVERSGLGDELNHVEVNKETFRSTTYSNIFALGDAAALPTSKAGSVAHFSAEIFIDNFLHEIVGKEATARFDGHANCFVETGYGKALLIDFNYDTEPLPGMFPLPKVGPLSLLKESRLNHWGKLAFRWIYWERLIKGRTLFIPPKMSLAGKVQVTK
jgi:sulfide:quinone oxidoreductase